MSKKRSFIVMDWLRIIANKVFPEIIPNNYSYENIDDAIELWLSLYYNTPHWLKKSHYKSLNLAASVAAEFARLIMIEFDVEITGSARADFINEQFKRFAENLRINIEEACAIGGFVLKPYVKNGKVFTDCITQDKFIPFDFNDDEITGAVFVNKIQKGKLYYFRVEKQQYDYDTQSHHITSKFYVSSSPNILGREIEAKEYPEEIDADITINNVDRPLFSFWRVPLANTIDKESPLGVSVYSRAVGALEEADLQWDRFLWEFKGGELAVDADASILKPKKTTDFADSVPRKQTEMPSTRDRLFRKLNARDDDGKTLYEVFSPTLRDESYANGLDKIKRVIEFQCSLAYGTISDPQNVDKTAEEVKYAKTRSYNVINNMQQTLQTTFENYIYAIDQFTDACKLASPGNYEIKFNWGDGVLEDNDKEQAIQLQEVNSGIRKKTDYLMWRYGVTEKQAIEMLPEQPKFESFFNEGGGS